MTTLTAQLVRDAHKRLKGVVTETPLQYNERLSKQYGAHIFLKREDLQVVRSYKLRGAYNCISKLSHSERDRGVVCASAGNHAQGVAFSCEKLSVKGWIYMPKNTPKQKVERVRVLGGEWVTIELIGDTFDDSYAHAKNFCEKESRVFVHPFDNEYVAAGQGTVAEEFVRQLEKIPDAVVVPIGGGGLMAGVGTYIRSLSNDCELYGVEPSGAASMTAALAAGKPVTVQNIDKFVDGAAVATVGNITFEAARTFMKEVVKTPEGAVCEAMIGLYQSDGIITEPAGALSVAALEQIQDKIKGKTVVCVISGGNNDISRYPEVTERALVHRGLKHYFIVEFSQRPGALREFLDNALGPRDDITLFEYVKKSNKERGPALVGVELSVKDDLLPLQQRMTALGISYEYLEQNSPVRKFLV
ncbi:MAG: threonine dehydratase [Candidatus Parcubacteria bacterium]|jgi:threonine dehydratase